MWCTRWYLPLLLLPFPIASPFYLMLWMFSITMHARPCFYCMALLSTMYISLCYWPPVPIDTPLVRPWSENITTFADAVRYKMPDLPSEKVPEMMPLEEHCWCDVSGGAFAPVNLTKWEEASVDRLVASLRHAAATEKAMERRRQCESEGAATNANGTSCENNAPTPLSGKRRHRGSPLMSFLQRWGLPPIPPIRDVPPPSTGNATSILAEMADVSAAGRPDAGSQQTSVQLPWFRREYDLRRFGFAMVLDFGWPSSHT
ncbi:hypothetical protein C8Q77DRAFT_1078765 [Trametes polyzona]|nr:hypothetical protein C8Q77DRAFT_1078765 [Trametes polyzona]